MKTAPKTLIFPTKKQAANYAANLIAKQIKKKPSSVLGLATGKTMIPLYKALTSKKINFSKVQTFNLDKYLDGKQTYKKFMEKHLFNKINIKKQNTHFPTKNYEQELKKIDLQILGIGRNGHIAFNEPGSFFNSMTRKVKLTAQTIRVNKSPPYALTMGIGTILKAKKIILLAFGKHKADAVARAINNEPTKKIPASALQFHKNVLFILDKQAAIKLK
jgi:glucosamine-6-phosphate deaminase